MVQNNKTESQKRVLLFLEFSMEWFRLIGARCLCSHGTKEIMEDIGSEVMILHSGCGWESLHYDR